MLRVDKINRLQELQKANRNIGESKITSFSSPISLAFGFTTADPDLHSTRVCHSGHRKVAVVRINRELKQRRRRRQRKRHLKI